MCDAEPRRLAASLLASVVLASTLPAQTYQLPHMEDASTVPMGALRLRAATAFTRIDARYTPSGVRPLGAFLTADSLGTAQLPALETVEDRIESASGAPFLLSLGRARLDATAREESIPLALEYGLTRRLSVGLVVPIVRKRVATLFRVDTAGGYVANVGPNPLRSSATARTRNALVQTQFAGAASALQTRLNDCQANPAGSGCAALLARRTEAEALIAASQLFAGDVSEIYGSAAADGSAFVPIAGSNAQVAIESRIATFNTQYRDLLGSASDPLTTVPFPAGGPAGPFYVEGFLLDELGSDSIATQERIGIGDVAIGARYALATRVGSGGALARVVVSGLLHLPTGSTQGGSAVHDLRVGSGATVLDASVAADMKRGRFGILGAARIAAAVAERESTPDGSSRTWTSVDLAPRWHLSEPFSLHLAWTFARNGDDSFQLGGGGVTYAPPAPMSGPLPWDVRFTHLQTISGSNGTPRYFRDQLEVRLYYRVLGR